MPKAIIFDLDNTLFPTKKTTIWEQMSNKAAHFISQEAFITYDQVLDEVRSAPEHYGSSVSLYIEKYGGCHVQEFIDYMHDINFDEVNSHNELKRGLKALNTDNLYLYTNGARSYAEQMLALLSIDDCFSGIFCLEDAAFVSKPSLQSFSEMISFFQLGDASCIFVDDCCKTLDIAKQYGFRTAYISSDIINTHPTFEKVLDFIKSERKSFN